VKLTVSSVAALKLTAGQHDKIIFDDTIRGWGIRLRPGGAYWVFQYGFTGKDLTGAPRRVQRRMTFGEFPAMSVPAARAQSELLRAAVKLGRDPASEKATAQASAGATFGGCVELYVKRRRHEGRLRPASLGEIERHLDRHFAALHALPIDRVDRRAIAIELARLTTERGPIEANRARTSLVKFFNWAIGEGFVDANPALHTNRNEETSRDRVLVDAELRAIWRAVPDGDYGEIVKLLMLTCARRTEIAELKWSEIDIERGVMALPPTRTKTRVTHIIPMSSSVRRILEARSQRDNRDYVFGRGRGFSGWSRCKIELDNVVKLEPFTLHDLRRAGATGMANLGVQPHVIEAVLNHTSGTKSGVAGIYNRSTYEGEKARALEVWDEHLTAVIAGRAAKVSSLKRA
jgi:integrase